ncbi:cytochrome P450 76A1 [Cucurbita moschata]|uniref:Cytochrome P450 76A1 n=1 Tax=Cucurbita moschata TaxID=3662 RepID=A0A6J1F4L5_CUCMO|nr:cytochrome P450 76A1 [Cucurbita moschata]
MEIEIAALILVSFLWGLWVWRRRGAAALGEQLPPGPTRWPVVGNLLQLSFSAHESFTKLAAKYGPIMTLQLGSMKTVVVSSSTIAREMFKNHDAPLSGRMIYEAMKGDHGTEGSLITSQYGSHWRMLRRLATSEFFVTRRLDAMQHVRRRCVDAMIQYVEDEIKGSAYWYAPPMDVGKFFFIMSFNLIGNLIFSKDLVGPNSKRGKEFYYHTRRVMETAGTPNVADFLRVFRWFDPQGIRRTTQFHVKEAFEIAGEFIKERSMEKEKKEERKKDYLDVLLEFRGDGVVEPSRFSSWIINVIVLEMFTAGTDTTTSSLEWAMAELLRNPAAMQKLQAELRSTIPPDGKLEETHLQNLPYLDAVVKETLRLHPPLPFLFPRMAMKPCKILGYWIPAETQVLVNVWAIGRDPKNWKDALVFSPERFLEPTGSKDFKGQHFDFLPFGSGRRMCPAVPLASRVLPMALGSLILRFDWALPDGLLPEEMDMSEQMGITLKKKVPLKAIPIPHKRRFV